MNEVVAYQCLLKSANFNALQVFLALWHKNSFIPVNTVDMFLENRTLLCEKSIEQCCARDACSRYIHSTGLTSTLNWNLQYNLPLLTLLFLHGSGGWRASMRRMPQVVLGKLQASCWISILGLPSPFLFTKRFMVSSNWSHASQNASQCCSAGWNM